MLNKNTQRGISYNSWSNDFVLEWGNSIFLNKKDLAPLEQIMLHRDNKISSSDIVYFTAASKLPRFKYKEYIETNKINPKKTNRIDYANTFILSINELKTLAQKFDEYCVIPVNEILNHSNNDLKKYVYDNNLHEVFIKKEYLIDYAEKNPNNKFPFSKTKINSFRVEELNKIYSGWGSASVESYIDLFNYLVPKLDKIKIILDESFSEIMNAGLIIDEEIYNNIAGMLSTKDNISMGMEIISNCDFKNSQMYILILLNEFYKKFDSKNKTSNFKNCLNYFKEYPISLNWEHFVKYLVKENKDEQEQKIINEYIKRQINTKYKNCCFIVNDIKVKELPLCHK
jgi:hypothetical protein